MNIQEAVKKAKEQGCCMAREAWASPYRVRVEPTDTPDRCIVHTRASKSPCRGWEPMAEDLIAEDWKLLGKYDGSEF